MRALRVVGISEHSGELSVVLEDSARQERFTVPADEQLRAAARGDLTRLGQISIELESQLRPREIQARIRAGASVDQVAAAAGVPPQKIERFAYPVLLERSRTAEVAQRAHPMRADGPDTRMLGDVVAHTFGLRGQEYHSAEWDSWKGEEGRWVVALSWRAGRSDNRALWTFQPGAHGGTVTAIDEHAHDLVEGLPARPLRTVGPVIDISRPDEQPPAAPEEGHALRAAASDIAARRDVSDWSRSAPEPRRSEPRRQAARTEAAEAPHQRSEPHARPDEPATEWPAPQRQSESAPTDEPRGSRREEPDTSGADERRDTSAAEAGTAANEPAGAGPSAETAARPAPAGPITTDAPETEPAVPSARLPQADPTSPAHDDDSSNTAQPDDPAAEPPAPRQAEPESPSQQAPKRGRKGKPVMPSWDEVLLGVRSQR